MTSEEKQEGEYDLGPTGYTQRLPVKWPPEPGGPDGLYAPLTDKQVLELRPEWLVRGQIGQRPDRSQSAPIVPSSGQIDQSISVCSVDQLLNHPGVHQILPGAYLFDQRGAGLQTSQSIIQDPGSWTGMFIRVGAGVTLVSIGVVVWLLVR